MTAIIPRALAGIALACVGIGSVAAQSFNCRYAKTVDEVTICRSPLLSQLDEQMSQMYFEIRNSLYGVQRLQLENGQAAWLRGRHLCGGDPSCIENAYRQCIRELSSY
jgi:uncharacterized protein